MLNKIKTYYPFFILLLLGLIPLLWFKPGYIASGHDMGYSLDPVSRILSWFFVWSESFDIGSDGSILVGSFPLYLPEAIIKLFNVSLQTEQKMVFAFWFVLPGFSMYFLLSTLLKLLEVNKEHKIFYVLLGSIFYSFNHYLLQGWFVAAKSEFSFVIATPIILSFLFKVVFYKEKPIFLGIISGLILTFFNAGGGPGSPLFGGFFIVFIWFFIFFTILKVFKILSLSLIPPLKFIFSLAISFVFLNAYWVFPFIHYIKNNFSNEFSNSAGGNTGVLNWIAEVSKHATFSNLIRLQGFSSWYNNETHPFASVYVENPFFIAFSFIFPLLFVGSLFLSNKSSIKIKAIVGFFVGLALLIIFFMSGTKSPIGFIYEALINHIPGFVVFRSPFYKFGYVLWITYAVLFAYSAVIMLDNLISWSSSLKKKKGFLKFGVTLFSLILLAIYSFPFFTGSFFNWNLPITTMIRPPSYVFDFQNWIKTNRPTGKILLYPPIKNDYSADIYSWNYWSLTPFPNLLSENLFLSNKRLLNIDQSIIVTRLYDAIEEKDKDKTQKLADLLNVEFILLRRDVKSNVDWLLIPDTRYYEAIIRDSSWFSLDKKFGEWELYRFNNKSIRKLVEIKNLVKTVNWQSLYGLMIKDVSDNYIILSENKNSSNFQLVGNIIGAGCINCKLDNQVNTSSNIFSRIHPTSLLYTFIKLKEEIRFKNAKDDKQKSLLYAEFSVKRLIELEEMVEKNNTDKIKNLIPKFFDNIKEMLKAVYRFRDFDSDKNNEEYNAHMRVYLSEIISRINAIMRIDNLPFEYEDKLQELKTLAYKLKEQDSKKNWETTSEDKLKYTVNVKDVGKYNIYVLPEKKSNYKDVFQENFLKASEITFNGIKETFIPQVFEKDKYSYGSVLLGNNQYNITLDVPKYKNLISSNAIKIPSYGNSVSLSVPNINKDKRYLFTYSFEAESARQIIIDVIGVLENGKKIKISYSYLEDNSQNEKRMIFDTPSFLREIIFRVKHENSKVKSFPIILKDLSLHQLVIPVIILEKENAGFGLPINYSDTEVNKINPTFYTIKINAINENSYLLFKEAYNNKWRAYFVDDPNFYIGCQGVICEIVAQIKTVVLGKKIPDSYHLEANGFANAWYFPKVENSSKISLIYSSQIILYFSAVISIISLIIIFLIILITFKKR